MNLDIELRVLLVAMAMLFVIGMSIFLVWKLIEPRAEGKSRSLVDVAAKPAAAMAGGIAFIGLCMAFPQVLGWGFGVFAVVAALAFFRMPANKRQAMASAAGKPDPQFKKSSTGLLLAVAIVLAAVFGSLAHFSAD